MTNAVIIETIDTRKVNIKIGTGCPPNIEEWLLNNIGFIGLVYEDRGIEDKNGYPVKGNLNSIMISFGRQEKVPV